MSRLGCRLCSSLHPSNRGTRNTHHLLRSTTTGWFSHPWCLFFGRTAEHCVRCWRAGRMKAETFRTFMARPHSHPHCRGLGQLETLCGASADFRVSFKVYAVPPHFSRVLAVLTLFSSLRSCRDFSAIPFKKRGLTRRTTHVHMPPADTRPRHFVQYFRDGAHSPFAEQHTSVRHTQARVQQ